MGSSGVLIQTYDSVGPTEKNLGKHIEKLCLGGLVSGTLLATTTPVFARDYWHRSREYNRCDHRADLRSDYHDLEEANGN